MCGFVCVCVLKMSHSSSERERTGNMDAPPLLTKNPANTATQRGFCGGIGDNDRGGLGVRIVFLVDGLPTLMNKRDNLCEISFV